LRRRRAPQAWASLNKGPGKKINSIFGLQVLPTPGMTDTQEKDVRRVLRRDIACSKTHVVYRIPDLSDRKIFLIEHKRALLSQRFFPTAATFEI